MAADAFGTVGILTTLAFPGIPQPEIPKPGTGTIYYDEGSNTWMIAANGGAYAPLTGGVGVANLQDAYDGGGAGGGLITLSALGGPFNVVQPTTNSSAAVFLGDASTGPGVLVASSSFTRSGPLLPNTAAIAYQAGITTHAADPANCSVIGYLVNSDKSPGGLSSAIGFAVIGQSDLFGLAYQGNMNFSTAVTAPGPSTGEISFSAAGGVGGTDPGHGITLNTGYASGGPANGGDVTVNLGGGAGAGVDGRFVVNDSSGTPFVIFDGTSHKITFTGAVDPTSVLLSGGTDLFFESNDGSTAAPSGAATGRIRYNDATGAWETSTKASGYTPLANTPSATTKNANYTILVTDSIIFVDTSGGSFTLTLPSPALSVGKLFYVIDSTGFLSTNGLTLARFAAENIEGLAADKVFLTSWGGWTVTTNGTDWFVF